MASRKSAVVAVPGKQDLEVMSEFRYQLRQFLRFSEEITHAAGITPLQYELLLHVRGLPSRNWPTVGDLAERLIHSYRPYHEETGPLLTGTKYAGDDLPLPTAAPVAVEPIVL